MFEKINILDLKPFIARAFDGDHELIKWHISGEDLSKCIEHTYKTILETSELLPLTCYKIHDYGYTILIENNKLIYSFGINILHRDAETLKEWFDNIKEILGIFDCILWSKNKRAITHLIKQGMFINEVTDDYTILTYKPCH